MACNEEYMIRSLVSHWTNLSIILILVLITIATTTPHIAIAQEHIPTTARTTPKAGGGNAGSYSSLALTSTGMPVMSYYDLDTEDLKFAWCLDTACTNSTFVTVDSTGNVGQYTSLVLTATGLPIISYYDVTNSSLKVARCNDTTCSNVTLTTVDSTGNVGLYTSLALNSSGMPVISYYDATQRNLKLAICANTACTSPTLRTLESTSFVGSHTSLALTATDIPVVSYHFESLGHLKLATCDTSACDNTITNTVVDIVGITGLYSSIALSSDNKPVIAYHDQTNGDLILSICDDTTCASPTRVNIDNGDTVGYTLSLALTTANIPVISYYDAINGDLKLAVCNDATTCSTPKIMTLDRANDVGVYSSIALTESNTPIISYYDVTTESLKLYLGSIPIDQGQPNSFAKLTPAASSTVTTATTTLSWATSMHADSYEYCYATTTSCTTWVSTGSTTSASISGLSHGTTYYWQVRATNVIDATLANSSTTWRFTVAFPPTALIKSLPVNNAKNQPTTVTLKWGSSTYATSYEYCIALTTATCTNWKSTGTNRQVTVRNLANNKIYYWQVRAKNVGSTVTAAGGFWRFTTTTGRSSQDQVSSTNETETITPSVDSQAADAFIPMTIDTPSGGGLEIGQYTSSALTSAGLPVVSYFDASNYDLKLAICTDTGCLYPSITTIDSSDDVGTYTSLALTSADIPVISYFTQTNANLKLAICNNSSCTAPTTTTIDSTGDVGSYASLALTNTNTPVISYFDDSNQIIKVAICNNAACTSPTIQTLESTAGGGTFSSLALTTNNIPVISYFSGTTNTLMLAICADATCSSDSSVVIDNTGNVGQFTSLAITSTNKPVISYYDVTNGNLKLAVCDTHACTAPALTVLDNSAGNVGWWSSLALTPQNIPVISYYDQTNADLHIAICADAACSSNARTTIDGVGDVGEYASLSLTTSGTHIISYYDSLNGNLKLYRGIATIDGQPTPFAKSSPTTASTIKSASTTLLWAASTYADSYEYCIATSATTCTTWISTSTTTSATISGLAHNTTYYWQVRAINAAGHRQANSGTMWRFTVILPPVSFAKSAPANNAKNQPTTVTLKWNASTRATSYEYCIALSTRACTNWKNVGTARQVTVRNLAKNKAYFWQVRAKNTGGTTLANGGYFKFTTAP